MDDLAQWLGEQLDEDARIARAATPGPWRVRDDGVVADDGEHWPVAYTDSRLGGEDCAHVVAHDPARVLREIDAKRRILARYVEADAERRYVRERYRAAVLDGDDERSQRIQQDLHHATLRLAIHRDAAVDLASVYVDRPGYREEWRP